jgi:hypothetical protein
MPVPRRRNAFESWSSGLFPGALPLRKIVVLVIIDESLLA